MNAVGFRTDKNKKGKSKYTQHRCKETHDSINYLSLHYKAKKKAISLQAVRL